MNKIIEAGDTLGAGVKLVVAVGVVYVVWKGYTLAKDVRAKADDINASIENVKVESKEFLTGTINPASEKNVINKTIGEYTQPVFFKIFDIFGVGK